MERFTLTLREARRLDQDVSNLIARKRAEIKTSQTISIFRADLLDEKEVIAWQDEVIEQLARVTALSKFRFYVREQIGEANVEKINKLTQQLAEEEQTLEIINGLVLVQNEDPYARRRMRGTTARVATSVINVYEINRQLGAMRANPQGPQELYLSVMTSDVIKLVDEKTFAIKRRIVSLKDALAAANATTKVVIDFAALSKRLGSVDASTVYNEVKRYLG